MSDTPTTKEPLLQVKQVSKSFPGVKALQNVSLHLDKGEVLSVIGENGAGKSTLMKILAGVQEQDAGEILIGGESVRLDSVEAALQSGISLIHQELNLADNLDVGANIFLGREPLKFGIIDRPKIREDAKKYLDMVGLDVSPDTIVSALTIGRQQMVEIAKALSVNSRILIMDEPTSSLSHGETVQLFKVVKDLRSRGISVIYISHRLGEVKELSDRVTVLRDGENAGDLSVEEINHDAMVKLMVGRDISQFYSRAQHEIGDVMLEVRGLRTPVHPGHELNFKVRAGEIVGMAGLVGAGRTEMLETIFGVTPAVAGEIRVQDESLTLTQPLDAIEAGMVLAPEDRKQQGLVLEMSVRKNMSLASLRRDQIAGFLNNGKESEISAEMIERMKVKTPSEDQIIQFLSGGNQQKVVLGKWLAMNPSVLLLDEPTRGIDVGAKQQIYQLMEELAGRGIAILFVSSEMEEIIGMADRALVMHEGRITGELPRKDLTEENIMQLATGVSLN
ncbi:MAG: D-xylose ABC transporter ATP-binding protein [Verrucomicrobiales bacterium]|nr:D-xylose ABC transporter ATP-binding protein [Verrucomicrobiales bacterium]|tara:strand:+ start:15366 stop:16880 length:1515 start_codon:yes stop_codon:yes gene_type:complete